MNTIQGEQYQLKGSINEVVTAHKAKSEAVESIVKVLTDAHAIDDGVLKDWHRSTTAVNNMKDQVWNDQGNTLVRGLDIALATVDRLGDEIVASARTSMNNGNVLLSPNEKTAVLSGIAASESASKPITTARNKYTIEVRTYNQIISVFPISWTAKMLGEEPRVGFEVLAGEGKAKNAGRLIDVATGH